jgi:2-polyprenyl-3-methyl-5-hydroxy-6-metoxy-1,4-benzoquinol methylase
VDLKERLSDEDLGRPTYLAASHLHRYAVAAELCKGLRVLDLACGTGYGSEILAAAAERVHGVDVDGHTIRVARAQRGRDGLEFTEADAVEFLRGGGADDFDAIVMFEALEHVPDPEAVLDELERLAADGMRLIVSVPNSRAFRESNPFHLTDFGYAEARTAFRRFGDVTMLYQVLAEGSVILAGDADGSDFRGRVGALEQAEPEYANYFIAIIGLRADAVRQVTAELNLVATPNHNRYMLELERANEAYFRTNRQLARGIYGKHDAAAAIVVARVEALEAQLAEVERALRQERAWRDAARYRAADRIADGVRRVPGLYNLLRFVLRRGRRGRSAPSRPSGDSSHAPPHRV